jgi:hypothetical protein
VKAQQLNRLQADLLECALGVKCLGIRASVDPIADEVRFVCPRHSLRIVEVARGAVGAVSSLDEAAAIVDYDSFCSNYVG